MHSEPAIESRAAVRGRRRKRGNGSNGPADGPVFVDNSGRRARLLRRVGTLLGAVCVGYAVVLGMAFMGWGTSLTPSSLLPFGAGGPDGGQNSGPGGGLQPQGGTGSPPARPTGAPPSGVATGAAPTAAPSAPAAASSAPASSSSSSPSSSASASAAAN
ncbi:hypothetical protein QFZ75_004469 [Streptomyces sp. V3I8]|uniref:hypothetical protein n=1 Tax=Streptomyces sp. V3I8 TaxID=3042279 RepID=UPI0027871EBC|nr:hypothetical protein [Streptomyces sp. V3I8]MDQ1038053.1 hypothetical protein [Streptomyces sp. V3I8]